MSEWRNIERPPYLGAKREQKFKEWGQQFGPGNWRLSWKVGETYVDLLGACTLYEDGYFNFLLQNQNILQQLINEASEVYDDKLSNIGSGFNYLAQETDRTHLQDIAIRRSLIRMGYGLKGENLLELDRNWVHIH